jgi:hypothetical protein
MATLITPRTRFLHVPKTGGTWVTQALQVAGVPCQIVWTRLGPGSRGHATLEQTRAYSDRFSFAFVRHPLDLYRSRWAANTKDGWPMNRFLHDARSADFPGFVDRVIERHPGFAGRHFAEFTGPAENEIAFVGRYETLVDDLVRALDAAGENYDEAALRSYAPANRSDYQRHAANYDLALAERVVAVEQDAILRWYCDDPLPARLLAGS